MDRAAAGARVVGAVLGATTRHPTVADADPVPGTTDGRPHPWDWPVGADVGGRLEQVVVGGVESEDGLGAGDADRDDRRRTRSAGSADLAKGKLRRKIPDLAQALTGHF